MTAQRGAAALLLVAMGFVLTGCYTAAQRINAFENLNPSSDYARKWTLPEAKDAIIGQTFLRNYPGKANEVVYFAPGGIAYQWISGRTAIASGTWVVDMRSLRASESAKVFVCTTFNNRSKLSGEIIPGSITNRCVDPSLFFIPASERARGDVFSMAGRGEAPANLTIERVRIEDIKRSLTTRS
jgi:hypothetical protein